MQAITDYKVITAGSAEDLTKDVNNQVRAGWQPFGSVSVAPTPQGLPAPPYPRPLFAYTQAMVKYSK
jgi:hypothetical protein